MMNKFMRFCLFFLLWTPVFAQEMTVQAISLHNRTAQDLIPMIQPLLPPGSVVTGQNYDLLIKTTPEGFAQIQPAIQQLDQPPQALVLRVRRVSSNVLDTEISSAGHVTAISSQSAGNTDNEQRVTVLDGQSAFVETGESFPYHDYGISIFGAQDITLYKDVKTGVILTPHLQGNQAQVSVQWTFNQLQQDQTQWEKQNSAITQEKTNTIVTLPLGQWVNIGGSSLQAQQADNATTLSTYNTQHPTSNLYISIDKALP